MKFYISILIVLLIACSRQKTAAQNKTQILNQQLQHFEFNFSGLMKTRGLDYYEVNPSLASIQANLNAYSENDSTLSLLFYNHQHDSLFIWCINYQGIEAVAVQIISEYELINLEDRYKKALEIGDQSRGAKTINNKAAESFQTISALVSKTLLPETIASVLKYKQNVLILPVLNIGGFPFYTLQPWHDSTYVIDRLTLAILPSFSSFGRFLNHVQRLQDAYNEPPSFNLSSQNIIIAGDPEFSANCGKGMNRLPGAKAEAETVAKRLNTTAFIGKDAKKTAISYALYNKSLLYFACHGIADTKDPLNGSYLLLADDEGTCGKLTAKMIQEAEVEPMALVFLSACRSGSGKSHAGGIIGLSRAFEIAGASNIIMSMWDVNDAATGKMMPMIVDSLFEEHGFFPATQMRNAILNYRKLDNNPQNWGAFSILGIPFPPQTPMAIYLKP